MVKNELKKAYGDADDTYLFKTPKGDIIIIERYDYNDDRLVPNCFVICCLPREQLEDFVGNEEEKNILNKIPIWEEGQPIVINLDVKIIK